MPEAPKVVDLVIQGSGVKASAALGAVIGLHDAGYRFFRISGSSSGAIVASLVMAYQTAGRDLHELRDIMNSIDFTMFEQVPAAERITGIFGEAWEALTHGGAYNIRYARDWLAGQLAETGITLFGDLRMDDTGSSFPESHRYALVLHASDISRRCHVRLPWDYREYGLDADRQLIADAAAASMAFPIIFAPVDVTTGTGGTVTWVDGGLAADYPLTVFDRTDGRPPRWPTWGIQLFGPPREAGAVRSAPEILMNCLLTIFDMNRYGVDEEGQSRRSIVVNAGADTIAANFNFHLTLAERDALYENGLQAAKKFLSQLSGEPIA
jgi:NTE family protein